MVLVSKKIRQIHQRHREHPNESRNTLEGYRVARTKPADPGSKTYIACVRVACRRQGRLCWYSPRNRSACGRFCTRWDAPIFRR